VEEVERVTQSFGKCNLKSSNDDEPDDREELTSKISMQKKKIKSDDGAFGHLAGKKNFKHYKEVEEIQLEERKGCFYRCRRCCPIETLWRLMEMVIYRFL